MLPAKLSKGHDSGSPFKILMAPELHRKYNLLNDDFNIFKDTASCLRRVAVGVWPRILMKTWVMLQTLMGFTNLMNYEQMPEYVVSF